jgi:hypothetical protein
LPSKQEGEFNSQYPRKKGKRERKRERETVWSNEAAGMGAELAWVLE